jgi:hypothetical protein
MTWRVVKCTSETRPNRAWPERDRQGTEGQVSPEAKGGRAGHVTCFIVIAVTGAGTC